MFENVRAKKNPIGLEFIKKGLLTETQVNRVLEYQKEHRDLKFGEIVDILDMCDKNSILNILSMKVQQEGVLLDNTLSISPLDYLPRDIIINYRALPFKIEGNKLSVAFADIQNTSKVREIELMLMNAGYEIVPYVTLYTSIMKQIGDIKTVESSFVDKEEKDNTKLIDNVIMTAITKRASDVHIEPMENKVRIRFRIDGEMLTVTELPKDRQDIITGRIKAIANMHQEITYDQDGSIDTFENFSIRVSTQKNVWGEKIVLRFLKKNSSVRTLEDLGITEDKELMSKAFDRRNSLIVVCAPTGEGKTTTLYSVLDYLNRPEINVVSIENPVEMRIPNINQVEIGPNISFASALRTVLRQDPDIILVGEIRDKETASIAIEAGQTGHLVLTTLHTIDSVEAVSRLTKMGISSYDVASTLITSLSQRLLRRLCPKCKKKHEITDEEEKLVHKIATKNDTEISLDEVDMYDAVGCDYCNGTGYYERIAAVEILCLDDEIKELIASDANSLEIKKFAMERKMYEPLVVDAVRKVLKGITTFDEVRRKMTL